MTYNNENAMMETKKDFILPAMVEDDCISVDVSEDYEGLRLSFPRVKIPGGGSLQFEIPSDDPENPDYTKYIEGVILYNHDTCAYWPEGSEYDDNVTPLCSSVDGKTGYGAPGGVCATCALNQYGSVEKGKGKACKNMRNLYILRSGEHMPIDLQLNTVFSVLPFAVQDHAHLIGLRQFIPDGDKPDHIVPVMVSTSCLLRYALVGGFHADNAILIARIIEDRPVISPDIPHGSPLLSRFLSVHRFSSAPSFLPFMPPRQICALHRSGGFPIPSHNPHKYRDAVLSAVSDFPCRCRAFS